MSARISWQDFWCWIAETDDNSQEYIAQQLDLERWLKRLSMKIQKEVLKSAPLEVVRSLKSYIHPKVYQKLVAEQ